MGMGETILVNSQNEPQDELTITRDLEATGNDQETVDRLWG